MAKRLRWLRWTLVIVAVVIAAAIAAPFLVPLSTFIPQLTEQASKAIGQPVVIRDLQLRLLPTPRAVATEYLRLIDGFVLDREDQHLVENVRSLGMQAIAAPTVMRTVEDRVALARTVLDFARNVREARALEVE